MRSCLMTLLAGVLMVGLPSITRAQTAQRLLEQGKRYFGRADFRRSIQVLRRAAAKTKHRQTLGQIHLYLGCCHLERKEHGAVRLAFSRALVYLPGLTLAPAPFQGPHAQAVLLHQA